jgi:hypothetical protein
MRARVLRRSAMAPPWARWLAGALTLLVLLAALAPTSASASRRRALLVGANEGWNEPRLSYARNDARKLREVLVQLGGFKEEDILLLEDPSVSQLREALGAMKRGFDAPTQDATFFVFYYSGHADRDALHLQGHPQLSVKELLHHLERVPATQKLGILDACQSGSILKGGKPDPLGFKVAGEDTLGVRGMALLVSSTANEPSQESRYLAGSFFTHHLVSGLFGLADANGDRKVSLDEVYTYSRERTSAATASTQAGAQHPGARIELTGYSDLYLTFLDGPVASLVVPPGWPRCYLMDHHESRLLAEIAPTDTARQLEVPPGSYTLKCEDSTRLLRVARFKARAGDRVDVILHMKFHEALRSEGLVKGSRALSGRFLLPVASGGALASGGVFWALARKEHSRLSRGDSTLKTPEDVRASISRGKSYQTLGLGLMGAGIIGLGAAAGMYVLRGDDKPATLGVATGGSSVVLHGRWP